MALVTIFALLGDDLRLIYAPKEMDSAFTWLNLTILTMFFIQLTLESIANEGYIFSFFFWLDFISTVSIITDIGPLMDLIMGYDTFDDSMSLTDSNGDSQSTNDA